MKRLYYLDYLRVFAIFAIVVAHAASVFIAQDYISINLSFYHNLGYIALGFFLMITGILLLNKDIPFSNLLQRIKRLFVCLAFFTILSLGAKYIFHRPVFPIYHLWYLYMIIAIYFLYPFLKVISKDEKLVKYFIVLALVFNLVLYSFLDNMTIPLFDENIKIFGKFFIPMGTVFYCFLGFHLNKYDLKKYKKYCFIVVPIVYILTSIYTSIFTNKLHASFRFDINSLPVFISTVGCFILIKESNCFNKPNQIISEMSKCTMGIYIFHLFFLTILRKILEFLHIELNLNVYIVVTAVLCFFISFFFTYLLRKIPLVKKYL